MFAGLDYEPNQTMNIRKVAREEIDETTIGLPSKTETPTVSELTRKIRETLETDFQEVTVQGEISGWTRAASGHTYFTLKDENAAISCVLWRNRQLTQPVQNGMKVVATGGVTVYPPRGAYQLDCRSIMPLGQGELQLAFERLKNRLHAEGLFDAERKQPLPLFPKVIGVVTSPKGAALRDILTTLARRMPSVRVVLFPALVQGTGAAREIALGIERLNRHPEIDLLIVGRGGGALEDLWAFNEEPVARAIAASRIPVISAVGHEIDFTIADFVADFRAATPTAAAEIAVRNREDILNAIDHAQERLSRSLRRSFTTREERLKTLLRSRGMHRPVELLRDREQQTDELLRRAESAIRNQLRSTRDQLNRLEASLRALDPTAVLKRGYAIVHRNGRPVSESMALTTGDEVTLQMRDGSRKAKITD